MRKHGWDCVPIAKIAYGCPEDDADFRLGILLFDPIREPDGEITGRDPAFRSLRVRGDAAACAWRVTRKLRRLKIA